MTGEASPTKPQLDEDTRDFVRRALASKLLCIDDVKKVVASLMAHDSEISSAALAEGLVGANLLTNWQSRNLLEGKSRGFFLGSYRLLRPLGKGGMGIVFLGEHQVMKRRMALKVLPSKAMRDERRIERFKEEARTSGQLDHPNIVRAHDFSADGDKFFIVMEFIDGVDLQQAIARDGVMSYADALDVMIQSAEGLAHAHERGIIHRDIKPSNMLLRTDGVVKVSDLGLARMGWAETETKGNRLMGTADFVAPEQALDSKTADSRADIYSLGCTFYFLLSGETPFGGGTVQQRLAKHQTAPPPDIRKVRQDCPAAIAELILRMMSKRPEDRPKSCIELVNQLTRIAGRTGNGSLQSRNAASRGDTVVDDKLMHMTIDDSSFLSSDSSSGSGNILSADEIDFGSLPPVDLPSVPTTRSNMPAPSVTPAFAGNAASKPAAIQSAKKSRPSGTNQQLLLGAGLTVAIIALLVTVGIMIHTINKPTMQVTPKIKSMEDGKNGRIIVVGE